MATPKRYLHDGELCGRLIDDDMVDMNCEIETNTSAKGHGVKTFAYNADGAYKASFAKHRIKLKETIIVVSTDGPKEYDYL